MTCRSSVRQAACVYSLIRPCTTGFRRICCVSNFGHGGAGSVTFVVGDVLCDALVRPGSVVARLIFRQNGAQVRLAEDQHPVQKLATQGADEALADRVHPGCLDGGDEDSGAGGLEDGVQRRGEVRSAVADQEPVATRGRTL